MPKTTKKLIEEFLEKGGKITKCPPQEAPKSKHEYKPNNAGPATIMTLSEGELFYGEPAKRRKKKELDLSKINLDEIPEELRKKLGL
ncbi:MAG: hypothetical protein HWN81_00205 [Candidatus Lokiarchaeota archaeon]|nr:hypothetical protein [Candidatus Lokiarchaeota archaeon]